MSFKEAEIAEASVAGVAIPLRDSLREPDYVPNANQVYDNMDTDPLIGATPAVGRPGSRVDMLTRVSPYALDLPRVREEAQLFCREHLQEGPEFPDAERTAFGRICTFESLVKAIADPSSPAALDDARALIRDAIDAPQSPTRLTRQRADLDGKNLSCFQMWSFPAADPATPLAEIGPRRQTAVDVLGLGYIKSTEEVVGFAFRLPAGGEAFRPTAWDAGSFPWWRPGGRTYRLDRNEYGLREVVHDRIRGEHLIATIDLLS